jgi:saccharopine dehydrogenase-like NADP-dependent oxidoreductase
MPKQRKRVVVLGGYGALGSRVSAAIARIPYVECVIAGRHINEARRMAEQVLATTRAVDIEDRDEVEKVLADADIVVNCTGPYSDRNLNVARFCSRSGIHYIDFADDRAYVNGVLRLGPQARRNNSLLVTGAGSLPVIAAVLVDAVQSHFSEVDEVYVHGTTGNQVATGLASTESLIGKVGASMRVKRRGRWRQLECWTEPHVIQFPDPVGRRRTYLYDVPNADEFARRYNARSANFSLGLQLAVFNIGLRFFGWLRRRNRIRKPERWVKPLFHTGRLFKRFGDSYSAVQVFVKGIEKGDLVTHTIALVEPQGEDFGIATSVALTLIRGWVENGVTGTGARSAIGMLDLDAVRPHLIEHGVFMVRA